MPLIACLNVVDTREKTSHISLLVKNQSCETLLRVDYEYVVCSGMFRISHDYNIYAARLRVVRERDTVDNCNTLQNSIVKIYIHLNMVTRHNF